MRVENDLTIYYYALILPGTNDSGPLAILEHIDCRHDIFSIKRFLGLFLYKLRQMSSTKIIHKIETDMSLALLQSCSQIFNNINLFDYIKIIYDLYENGTPIKTPMTVLHICSSHLIKTVCLKLKKCFPNKDEQKDERIVAKHLIAQVLHCRNVEEATDPFTLIIKIYGTEFNPIDLKEILKKLDIKSIKKKAELTEDDDEQDDKEVQDKLKKSLNDEDEKQGRKGSPYFIAFSNIKKTVIDSTKLSQQKNKFYSAEFMKYFLDFLIPYFGLWSAAGIIKFGIKRDSNAPVENHFKIYKHLLLNGKKNILAPRFIRLSQKYNDARLTERKYILKTTRAQQKKEKAAVKKEKVSKEEAEKEAADEEKETAEEEKEIEVWVDKKCKTSKIRRYFKMSKYVDTINYQDLDFDKLVDSMTTDKVEDDLSGKDENACVISKALESHEQNYENYTVQNVLFNTEIKYPLNFPNLTIDEFGGFVLTAADFETLMPYKSMKQYLNDNIVNAFFSLLPLIAQKKEFDLLTFDTHFIEKIKDNGEASFGFKKWATLNAAWDHGLWLIPINDNNVHWTMLVILLKRKIIVHLDSLHQSPDETVLNGILNFIQSGSNSEIKWDEWKLFVPKDNPSQVSGLRVGGNCGIHVCVWAYIISSGSNYKFSEKEMNTARIGISNFLTKMKMTNELSQKTIKSRNHMLTAKCPKRPKYEYKRVVEELQITSENILGFESIFDLCASLHIIINSETIHPRLRIRT